MTAPSAQPEQEWLQALQRSAIYGLLSHTTAYPTAQRLAALRAQLAPFLGQAESGDRAVDAAVAGLLAKLETSLGELQRAFNRQFSHIVSPDCPTHETAYSPGDVFQQAHVMADVAGFYRAHGLRVGGEERERPDHIGAELEFMGFMARKQAHALESLAGDQVEECQRTQAAFLRDHLGCWGPSLGQRIHRMAASPFYQAVGTLLARWLPEDMCALGVQPQRVLDEPLPAPPPDTDDAPCGVTGADAACASGQLIEIDQIRGPEGC